jgi:hypothetical protein
MRLNTSLKLAEWSARPLEEFLVRRRDREARRRGKVVCTGDDWDVRRFGCQICGGRVEGDVYVGERKPVWLGDQLAGIKTVRTSAGECCKEHLEFLLTIL